MNIHQLIIKLLDNNEYRTLLADRILTQINYEIEKEIRYLELLKLRFGETQLHYCEVMLKDVADSKRLNARVTDARNKTGELLFKCQSRQQLFVKF
jgi:anaphase-promoting complex subunit 2